MFYVRGHFILQMFGAERGAVIYQLIVVWWETRKKKSCPKYCFDFVNIFKATPGCGTIESAIVIAPKSKPYWVF